MNNTVHNRIFRIARREVFRIATRPLYLFCMIIAIYSGHEMISGKSKKRKTLFPMENSKPNL